jgi:hypothetical protein
VFSCRGAGRTATGQTATGQTPARRTPRHSAFGGYASRARSSWDWVPRIRAVVIGGMALLALPFAGAAQVDLTVDPATRTLRFPAEARPSAFAGSLPPDHQYHAVVSRSGGAADRALFVTPVSDAEIARVLRTLGAEDGGGVPMAAWNLRWVPLVPQPATRVSGSLLEVLVEWNGQPPIPLDSILNDPGGKGLEFRFGGNEEHDDHWGSGCILCLFSCPGGVISNAAYTIRDHQRGVTHFTPSTRMPPDGTAVTITVRVRERAPPP